MSQTLDGPTATETMMAAPDAGAAHPFPHLTGEEFLKLVRRHVKYTLAKDWERLPEALLHHAVSLAVRDLMIQRMLETERRFQKAGAKRVYYLSMEFLVGRSLGNNVVNLGIDEMVREALQQMGTDLEELREFEVDAALGNGGLGRLAACFLDSLATLDMPGYGYGINYEYGLFKQVIEDGRQVERPDHWRQSFSPWLVARPYERVSLPVYGRLVDGTDREGNTVREWAETHLIVGVPYDMPIVGYGGRTVNYLRLYTAQASTEFDFQKFSEGKYVSAIEDKIQSERISKVLYPADDVEAGRELRLLQEYFFVGCAIRDIVRSHLRSNPSFSNFPDLVAIQLNDTHPALAVADLMRILMDEHHVPWDEAWRITEATFGFTNHTLLPEALEKWPVELLEKVVPRHLDIIYGINERFLAAIAKKWPGDAARAGSMSIIEEGQGYKHVRMAHLAIAGSHAVNGVAKLHSDLVTRTLVPDFYELWPEKFSNKTNGVTQRRWLLKANPGLSALITKAIGPGWVRDLDQLRLLEQYADDAEFQNQFNRAKLANKERLALTIKDTTGIIVDPKSLFDVIAKRLHEYKRQLLMAMRVIDEYLTLIEERIDPPSPRTYIFAGKAAPSYWAAKQIIRLVNSLARIINNDRRAHGKMCVVFAPDYRVSLAERIIPAANVSEQISTAGKEASGTSNMKFSMNGALTVCTLDGANLEIRDAVGHENIFSFGLTADEIQHQRAAASYNPRELYMRNPRIQRMMDVFVNDTLFRRDVEDYRWIYHSILDNGDPYFHLADFESYLTVQHQAGTEFRNLSGWARKAILCVSRMGWFSSDRTIREYADEIWKVGPV